MILHCGFVNQSILKYGVFVLTNRITFNVTTKTIDFIVLSVIIEETATFEKIFTFGGEGGGGITFGI